MDPDPDPELLFWIRIQQKIKEQLKNFISEFRPVNSGLCVLKGCIVKQKMADSWYIQFFMIKFKVFFIIPKHASINNMVLIRIRNSKKS